VKHFWEVNKFYFRLTFLPYISKFSTRNVLCSALGLIPFSATLISNANSGGYLDTKTLVNPQSHV